MKTNKTEKLENMKNASSQFGYDLENYCSVIPLKEITQSTDGSKKFDPDLELITIFYGYNIRFKGVKEFEEFGSDLKNCLTKVLKDFPEFSNITFEVVVSPEIMPCLGVSFYLDINGRLAHHGGAVYTIFCGSEGIKALYDDETKEGALAHELGEVVHLLKKGPGVLPKLQRWYKENSVYDLFVQMNADLTSARRGYGHKVIKALRSLKHQTETEDISNLDARIKNLEGYLKK